MIWIVPSEKGTDNAALEKRLWDAASAVGQVELAYASANGAASNQPGATPQVMLCHHYAIIRSCQHIQINSIQ